MESLQDNNEKEYGHANPAALFPLFSSDKEYELIESVILDRFRGIKQEISVMYKYLASQHMPKFVIFSKKLPYGIVIKRLTPELAWREVFCDKILRFFHYYDFRVKYHNTLGCISQKYLYGYDIHELPKRILQDDKILKKIFYWLGKAAAVAYVFGIGDRGHNERINLSESNDIIDLYAYTLTSEPIVNIDFETFASIRLLNYSTDLEEIALTFYAIFYQIFEEYKGKYTALFELYKRGFLSKLYNINDIWKKRKDKFNRMLLKFFRVVPHDNQNELLFFINQRATIPPEKGLFRDVFGILETYVEKVKNKKNIQDEESIRGKIKQLKTRKPP